MGRTTCDLCGANLPLSDLFAAGQIRESLQPALHRLDPQWNTNSYVCDSCLDRARADHLQDLLAEEHGELTSLDEKVLRSLAEREILTQNTESVFDRKQSIGDRLADRMASFGGSWKFLIFFCVFLGGWILLNEVGPKAEKFDPFPFILLNLILSCLAAVQAPIIMMSQNRQEAKDRLRNVHDYQINLKAELEIRQLHMKMDQLLKHQWRRLIEIQQLQVELLRDQKRAYSHLKED